MSTVSQTVNHFIRRSEFWLTKPGEQRYHFWEMNSADESYSYTAGELVRFTQENCLAIADPNSSDISDFLIGLKQDSDACLATQPDDFELALLLSKWVPWIDHLFFFDIITRQMRDQSTPNPPPLIELEFRDQILHPDGINRLNGIFLHPIGKLKISLYEPSFDSVLCIIVHELCHVYLHLLVKDDNASRYFREVEYNGGHGTEFHNLLQFIYAQLFKWMPDWLALDRLSWEHQEDLQAALAEPRISEAAARSILDEY